MQSSLSVRWKVAPEDPNSLVWLLGEHIRAASVVRLLVASEDVQAFEGGAAVIVRDPGFRLRTASWHAFV